MKLLIAIYNKLYFVFLFLTLLITHYILFVLISYIYSFQSGSSAGFHLFFYLFIFLPIVIFFIGAALTYRHFNNENIIFTSKHHGVSLVVSGVTPFLFIMALLFYSQFYHQTGVYEFIEPRLLFSSVKSNRILPLDFDGDGKKDGAQIDFSYSYIPILTPTNGKIEVDFVGSTIGNYNLKEKIKMYTKGIRFHNSLYGYAKTLPISSTNNFPHTNSIRSTGNCTTLFSTTNWGQYADDENLFLHVVLSGITDERISLGKSKNYEFEYKEVERFSNFSHLQCTSN